MTAAPRVIDTFKNLKFVFDNPFVFDDRFNGEGDYFGVAPGLQWSWPWATNFVADVMEASYRRKHIEGEGWNRGDRRIRLGVQHGEQHHALSQLRLGGGHLQEGAPARPRHSRPHPPGTGHTLMWQEGQPIHRVDWRPGSMVVPPEMWFHQHFNTCSEPVLFLAIGWGSEKPKMGGKQYVYTSVRKAGQHRVGGRGPADPPRLRGRARPERGAVHDGEAPSVLHLQVARLR